MQTPQLASVAVDLEHRQFPGPLASSKYESAFRLNFKRPRRLLCWRLSQGREFARVGIECNNGAYDLLERDDRTEAETQTMIDMAHAAKHHWGKVGTPVNWLSIQR